MDFKVDKVAIYEPRLDFGNGKRPWVITKSAENSTYISYPADSYSSSSINFNLKPPSKWTIADRVMEVEVPVRLTFTARYFTNNDNTLASDRIPITANTDGFRYMPFSSCVESIQMKINGYSVSCQLKDIIHPLSRYHTDGDFLNGANSVGPNMMDYTQGYYEDIGGINNPLAPYINNAVQVPRGAYPLVRLSQTRPANNVAGEWTCVLEAKIREFIFLPPCIWNNDQVPGLVGLDNLQFVFTLTNLYRMWSRSLQAVDNGGSVDNDRITSLNVVIYDKPNMYVNWLSPPITQAIPRLIQYPYFEITRYNNSFDINNKLAPGATRQLSSNQISLNSIPRKIFIYANRSDAEVNSGLNQSIYSTNTYLRINKLSLDWGNQNSLFAGADILNLYQMSCKNGLKLGFVEFYGTASKMPAFKAPPDPPVLEQELNGTVGSVICIVPSGDLPLASNESEGMLCQKNLKVTVEVQNCCPVSAVAGITTFNTFAVDLNIICVYDGVLEIYDNSARSYIGVINEDDVVNTPIDHSIDYNLLGKIYGGSALEKFKNLTSKAINVARKGNKFLKDTQAISHGLDAFGKTGLADKARQYGYGAQGGVLYEPAYGGKKVTKKGLKTRLAKY